ncbi:hypothetical protein INT44_006493 [Umbelopsis vinacea]|uniref:Uncharacterized protein n=1 Tax=Umbelopsis vinacea TaxID=44442 RepID=A0A8H7UE50_9FUNG|nr:hypothetical protein INT44_006493 [Umbelopsis vinacea]KAI9283696.1 hypothetical protein BC943DRAFT_361966 [Umbelopsis sp. AD052]
MASNKLARNSLDALLKASPSHKITKSKNAPVDKKQRLKLPATKTGLKRIKQEIRYGHQQKIRSKESLAQSRQNPIGLVHKDEKKAQDNLAKNVRYMTRALKASDTERDLRKQALEYRNKM